MKILVVSTKRDLPNCITLGEIIDAFQLMSLDVYWNCIGVHKADIAPLIKALDKIAED